MNNPLFDFFDKGLRSHAAFVHQTGIPSNQAVSVLRLSNEDDLHEVSQPIRRSQCCNAKVFDSGLNTVCDCCGEYCRLIEEA